MCLQHACMVCCRSGAQLETAGCKYSMLKLARSSPLSMCQIQRSSGALPPWVPTYGAAPKPALFCCTMADASAYVCVCVRARARVPQYLPALTAICCRKLVKKCKMHSGGVYALVTNRIMLPQAGESNPLLALARQLESSRSVIDRVTKANVPEHDVSHSPLRLPHGSGKDVLEEHTSYVDAASAAEVQTAPTDEGLPFVSCAVVLVV